MMHSAQERFVGSHSGRPARWLLRRWSRLAASRARAIALCALLGFALPAAYGMVRGLPEPQVSDEISYLLAADTFASGRLSTPTHPMWRHFQCAHVLHIPSYASKYPPGQGLFLAAGQLLGHPALGIWLSSSFAAAALCWMLQAWTRPRWALLATVMMVLSIGTVGMWVQTYWGGMVAAGGGALFFGGLRRLLDTTHWRSAVAMACGVVVLANSRPFEGLIVTLPALFVFLGWLIKSGPQGLRQKLLQGLFPAALTLSLGAGWMLFYNARVTGDALRLPYSVHQEQYFRVGIFAFQEQQSGDELGHPRLRRLFNSYRDPDNSRLYVFHAMRRLVETHVHFFYGAVLAISLLTWPWMIRRPWLALAVFTWFLLIAGMSLATFNDLPHYAAPITALAYLLCIEGLRRIRLLRGRLAVVGRVKVRYLLLLWAAVWACREVPSLARALVPDSANSAPTSREEPTTRSELLDQLAAMGGKHLLIVHYDDDFPIAEDWVYNDADIDKSTVVWAHELDEEANRELMRYFDDRRIWRLRLGQARGLKLEPTAESGVGVP